MVEELELKAVSRQHAQCLLLIDTSSSMSGDKINSVNEGIKVFFEQLNNDEQARDVVDVAIVTFDSNVTIVQEYMPVSSIDTPPVLSVNGLTSMGKGLEKAIDMVIERKNLYLEEGVESYIPWIVMFTDGEPTDDITIAKQRLEQENANSVSGRGRIQLWALAVKGANVEVLKSLTKRVLYVTDSDYTKIFDWTRKSLAIVSASKPGELPQFDSFEGTGAQTNCPSDWV